MSQGTIAKKMDKGFGFIKQEGVEKDLFFHAKDLNGVEFDALKEGDAVTFDVGSGPKGPFAQNVQVA